MRSGPTTRDTSSVALGLAQIRIGSSAANIGQYAPILTAAHSMGAMAKTAFNGKVDFWKMESGFPLKEDISIPLREASSLDCTFQEMTSKNLAIARGLDPFEDVLATASAGTKVSASGTINGVITVNGAGGVVADQFMVVFTGATAGSIFGRKTGHIHDFVSLASIIAPLNGANPYFSIPANFFTGTWAADDTFVFETTPFVPGSTAYADSHQGDIKLGAMKAPAYVRMESVYTYPNGINHMYIIFPRANAVSSVGLDYKKETAVDSDITFESKSADEDVVGGNAVWNDAPLGHICFD